ncbi:MAG: hypothetical protein E7347_00475 [Clostridiales bacterium]|nr:hypothetical protein [Clostridiales bacterium]
MVNLILTKTYDNLFPTLVNCLEKNSVDLNKSNLVFCEAKVSLMVERMLCAKTGGSFNTGVYSFGSFLRSKKSFDRVLSKEGSSMVIKRILSAVKLNCFKQSKTNLAPALYELIIQLKSAKITPKDVENATLGVKGVLQNKLLDVALIYNEYEKFIKDNAFEDQSSLLSYLPSVIDSDQSLSGADVYLVGYSGFTAQMRSAITSLIKKAKSLTAILVEGENPHVYVNETANFIRTACRENGVPILESKKEENINAQGKFIIENLFNPFALKNKGLTEKGKISCEKIYTQSFKNPSDETERVGQVIRNAVLNGECRYRDITVAISTPNQYGEHIKQAFNRLNIPYFLDEQKIPHNHPLINLITSYIDAYRLGFESKALAKFFKNPLFTSDKNLADLFENYLIKYNINYSRIKSPFVYEKEDGERYLKLESLRKKLISLFSPFSVQKMLDELNVEKELENLSAKLKEVNEYEESAVTEQIYGAVSDLLCQMNDMLSGVQLSLIEYKNIFLSGVSAMKLSILPQYNDAVFIGGFKETALAKARKLFVMGLTSEVPAVQADVALLSDDDISELGNIKVLVEPKIRIVNHRTRENVALALSAFSDELYLSYPTSSTEGKKNLPSEVYESVNKWFTVKKFPKECGYLSFEQAVNTFARACGEFAERKTDGDFNYDFTLPSSFYYATDAERLKPLLEQANKEVKVRLSGQNVSLIKKSVSPTTIEDYYKCPYRAFINHSLNIKEREDGKVSVLSVGNVMHEILNKYVDKISLVSDKNSSDNLLESIQKEILSRSEYEKFLGEPSTSATLNRVVDECKRYCYKTFLSFKNSTFNKTKTEASFGDFEGAEYPAIKLDGGKVSLKGKIDRVDESENYFRVIDYKTGKADPSEKALFAGVKLQLYLYAGAVMNKYAGEKFPLGLYYLPISDKYEKQEDKGGVLAKGKTLCDLDALTVQDKGIKDSGESEFFAVKYNLNTGDVKNAVDKSVIKACVDYALLVSEKAVQNMKNGVIVASPYDGACDYCEYSALCGLKDACQRTIGAVDDSTFTSISKGENE